MQSQPPFRYNGEMAAHPVVFEQRLAFDTPYGCWRWTAPLHKGYGYFGRHGAAHRYSYERRYGPIPVGLEIDHFLYENPRTGRPTRCIGRACVNHEHLRAVTHSENIKRARVQVCPKGHPLDEEHSRERADCVTRICIRCEADYQAAYRVKMGINRGLRPALSADDVAAAVRAYEAAKAAGSRRPTLDAAESLGISRAQLQGRVVKARGRKRP